MDAFSLHAHLASNHPHPQQPASPVSVQLYSGDVRGRNGTFSNGKHDAWAQIDLPGKKAWCKTRTIDNDNDPVWEKQCGWLNLGANDRSDTAIFAVWDSDDFLDDNLLTTQYLLAQLRERCSQNVDWRTPWNHVADVEWHVVLTLCLCQCYGTATCASGRVRCAVTLSTTRGGCGHSTVVLGT